MLSGGHAHNALPQRLRQHQLPDLPGVKGKHQGRDRARLAEPAAKVTVLENPTRCRQHRRCATT
jgi:hypothetical protein